MLSDLENRFFDQVVPEPNSGCWLWNGSGDGRYGQISVNGKLVKAHRFSWGLHRYPIPRGKIVCHLCDVTWCVNPDHLFIGTQSDNLHDAAKKGRNAMQVAPTKSFLLHMDNELRPRGDKHGKTKIAVAAIEDIRRSKEPTSILAARYGVHRTTIQRIRSGARRTTINTALHQSEEQ